MGNHKKERNGVTMDKERRLGNLAGFLAFLRKSTKNVKAVSRRTKRDVATDG